MVPSIVQAWGEKGHFMVNRLAIQASSDSLPDFMRESAGQLIYNAYEPDRWRDETGSPMNEAQALDHYFDSELWGDISTIPAQRYQFMSQLVVRKVDLVKTGYLPYAIIENYGRLRNAFRRYRNAQTPEDRVAAGKNAVLYAGLLGHYVGDGAMPMHLSIHYNGWADGAPNPRNFTKDRGFHERYENAFVNSALGDEQVRPLVLRPRRLNDVFGSVREYLSQTFSELEPMYELERTGEFSPAAPRPKGTAVVAAELARAATMLGSLWYTAWVESGEPPSPIPAR